MEVEESFQKSSLTEQEGRGQMELKYLPTANCTSAPTQLSFYLDPKVGSVLVMLSPVMLAEPSWVLGT